jgi:hypothetical protein
VLGAGLFENRWTRFGEPGGRALTGFVAIGDAYMETNPMYGRGCSAAFLEAHVLGDLLEQVTEPRKRVSRYYATAGAMLKPYYELSIATDRMYHLRARRSRGEPLTFGERVLNWGYEAAWMPAVSSSLVVAREMVKSAEMRELSSAGTRLAVVLQLVWSLIRALFGARPASPAATPQRIDLLRRLPPHEDDGVPGRVVEASLDQ